MNTSSNKVTAITTTSSTWTPETKSQGDWYNKKNWSAEHVPTNVATFASSSMLSICFSGTGDNVDSIIFDTNSSPYTFTFDSQNTTPALTISGNGVTNNSSSNQNFIIASNGATYKQPQLLFSNSATAGTSNVRYSAGPWSPTQGYGGGIISFCDTSTAGSALFTVTTGPVTPPKAPFKSTVGGEVSFSNTATAGSACFTIYGTTSNTDGDTFGNVVFHDHSTAANATFTNVGGTMTFKDSSGVPTGNGGDGGNTQFYDNTNANGASFDNQGAVAAHANGGDTAFDGTSNAGTATINNHPATAADGFGGVTSFNNTWGPTTTGASANQATIHNHGAKKHAIGGGGHTEFTAKYGNPTADKAKIYNYGSEVIGPPSKYGNAGMAGHTIFSISLPCNYFPTAGSASFYNHPGTIKGAAAGYTEFSVYSSSTEATNQSTSNVPTAGNATFHNYGGTSSEATGGYTAFKNTSNADAATINAYGGTNGGYGGKIAFYDDSTGDTASIKLTGNGVLDLSYHNAGLSIKKLIIGDSDTTDGVINTVIGTDENDNSATAGLTLSGDLELYGESTLTFSFWTKKGGSFKKDTNYTILKASNIKKSNFDESLFKGKLNDEHTASFYIDDTTNELQVYFKS